MAQSPEQSPWEWVTICGLRVARISRGDAVAWLRRCLESDRAHLVVTLDASGVVIANEDIGYRDIVNAADLVTPDGTGILWAARRQGTPLVERVSGVDLVGDLAAMCAETGRSVFLFGAHPGIAAAAAEALVKASPGLTIAGVQHGYYGDADEAAIIETIHASGADVLLIGMGIPRQEKWAWRHLDQLGAKIVIGVGGSFDVLSGRKRRAPVWMQKHCLEWLWRLIADPTKIKKNLLLPRFVCMVMRSGHKPTENARE